MNPTDSIWTLPGFESSASSPESMVVTIKGMQADATESSCPSWEEWGKGWLVWADLKRSLPASEIQ